MTRSEFRQLMEEIHARSVGIMMPKSMEYADAEHEGDPFANFKECSDFVGVTPEQVLGVYLFKHMKAIYNFIKTLESHSNEPITGRLSDAHNYLDLLEGLLIDSGLLKLHTDHAIPKPDRFMPGDEVKIVVERDTTITPEMAKELAEKLGEAIPTLQFFRVDNPNTAPELPFPEGEEVALTHVGGRQ